MYSELSCVSAAAVSLIKTQCFQSSRELATISLCLFIALIYSANIALRRMPK